MKNIITLILLFLISTLNLKSQQNIGYDNIFINQGCSSFCLDNNGYAVFGTNYDFTPDRYDGLVIVNKRNIAKSFHKSDSLGEHVQWTSRYGSISFNFIASQTSWTGMNEAGLVIYSMRLNEGSRAPDPDKRPWIHIHFWLQYMLDNYATIEEVTASDSIMRIASIGRIPHYLVCDRYGKCATIEFIDGKMVTHSGKYLPVKALANTAYARSLAQWNHFLKSEKNSKRDAGTEEYSGNRFIRIANRVMAFIPTDINTTVNTAFDILKEVGERANWSIVFDTKNLRIHFKTIIHSEIRTIAFQKLDFSCQSAVRMIDINEKLSGDISDQLKEYSFKYHFDKALHAAKQYELKMSAEDLKKYIQEIEAFKCLESVEN